MSVRNQVQLITYPDSLGGNLNSLHLVLEKYFPELFSGGIHILPPFPSSGDRGFAPLTYLEIEPQFGSWDDIRRLSEKPAILLDLMLTTSQQNLVFFRIFILNGRDIKYADLFITLDQIWQDGEPVKEDLEKIFLRRAVPFSEFQIKPREKLKSLDHIWGNDAFRAN